MNINNLIQNIQIEEQDFRDTLHLTANENRLSQTAEQFLTSPLSYRYLLGTLPIRLNQKVVDTGGFVYKGMPAVASLEQAATAAALEMFGAAGVDFRPTSGMSASMATALTFSNVGDNVYSIKYDFGGHFATKHFYERMGRNQFDIPVDRENYDLDYDAFAQMLKSTPADLVILEPGTPLFSLDLQRIRDIIGPDCFFIYDGAHTLGLIAGGQFQDPFNEGVDLIQGNTHKTFPGPQKGMILTKTEATTEQLKNSISSGLVSSSHVNTSIALFITTLEMQQYGHDYAQQILSNTQALGEQLLSNGFELINRNGVFSQSEQVLIHTSHNKQLCNKLQEYGISTNAREGFMQPVIRIGVQEITRRGMKEADMRTIADFIAKAANTQAFDNNLDLSIREFNSQFNNIHYSFDNLEETKVVNNLTPNSNNEQIVASFGDPPTTELSFRDSN